MTERRFTRYPVNLRLRLQFPSGELETTTDEISLAGFSAPCADLPEVGTRFGFVVHLPDGALVQGAACAMRLSPDGLSGFSAEFEPAQLPAWEAFLAQEQANGGVWRMIGRYASSAGEEKEAARSVLERGPLGILFKRVVEKKADAADEAPGVLRLHMVGENGEAYRVAFEKHESDAPDSSLYADSDARVLELTRRAAARVLRQDVFLKRSPTAPITPVRLVELVKGGYGYVVQHPTAKPSLMGLQGSELIVIEADGKSVFPSFDKADLDRIALDTFRRVPEAETKAAAPVQEERFSEAYVHRQVDSQRSTGVTQRALIDAMTASQRVQTRVYGERSMRLFPDVWVELQRPGAWVGPVRGFAMEDAEHLCVFVLSGPGAPCVVRLEPKDVIAVIRGRGEL